MKPIIKTAVFVLLVISFVNLSAKDTALIFAATPLELNLPPVANAGVDQVIILPTNSINLDGFFSSDPDNNITNYEWTKISGPSSFNIVNPTAVQTQVLDLVQGVYLFELKVTDAGALFSKDTMQVTVVPSCYGRPLVNASLVPMGTLSLARYGLKCGTAGSKILFAGGWIPGPLYPEHSSRVDIYDTITHTWSTAELTTSQRDGMVVGSVGNKIFFAGGGDDDWIDVVSRVDIYDAASNTWSTAELSTGRNYLSTATLGNKIFFGGGGIWGPLFPGFPWWVHMGSNVVDIYDNSTDSWSTATLSEGRYELSATTMGNKIYFAGGLRNIYFGSDRIDIYDASTNSWSTSQLQEVKASHTAVAIDNKIFWAAGANSSYQSGYHLSNQVEIKDTSTGLSSFSCITPKAMANAVFKNDTVVFFTGYNSWPADRFDIYDKTINTWSDGKLPVYIQGSAIISVNNEIYVAGGSVNGAYSSQVWKLRFDSCTNSSHSSITTTACDTYTLNGQTYTLSGVYTQVLINSANCDSILTLHLTINHSTNTTISVTACDSYTWQGQTYTVSGIYTDTLVSSNNCDSIINLNLTINYKVHTSINATICEGQSYGGHVSTGVYIDTLVAVNGCDSIRTLNLLVNSRAFTAINASICAGQNYEGHNSTGIYIDTLVASNGCDSIRTLYLRVNPVSLTSITVSICKGQSYEGHTSTGIYIDTLVASNGCDSIRTLDLTVNSISFSSVNASICSGQNYAGHISAGIYIDTLISANGCDSIRTLSLAVRPASFSTVDTAICPGQNYAGHTTAGVYADVLIAANGCDSVRTLNLTIKNNCSIYIPNAFTPNNDGLNDLFKPTINLPIQKFSFIIFNRYGERIFETDEYGKGWDGTYKGKPQPTGSYVYRITFTNISGWVSENDGTFLLLR